MNNSKVIIAALVLGMAVLISLYISTQQKVSALKAEVTAQDVLIKHYEIVHKDMTKLLEYRQKMETDTMECYESLKKLKDDYENART